MDCPICKCDLGYPEFEAIEQDTDISEDVFRLKCGHAFHNSCLCRALRTENKCPTCRQGPEREEEELRLIIGADGLLAISQDEDITLPSFNVAEARQVSDAINQLRSDFQLQKLRRQANIQEKKYRAIEQELLYQRRAFLKEAMSQFRSQYRQQFEKQKRVLRNTIKKVRLYELERLSQMPEMASVDFRKYIDFNLDSRVGADFGPLKKRFWI